MNAQKTALFFFSNPEKAVYLAKALIELGWAIKAPVHNALTLEEGGIDRKSMKLSYWGNPDSFITPSTNTILGIRGRTRDQSMLERYDIDRVDLVCVDFHAVREQAQTKKRRGVLNIMRSESAKAFLLLAAIEGGKIPVCEPHDRKLVADWMTDGMPNKRNFMLRLMASASLRIARELLDLGAYCDNLRK